MGGGTDEIQRRVPTTMINSAAMIFRKVFVGWRGADGDGDGAVSLDPCPGSGWTP